MKAFVVAVLAIAAITVGADMVLERAGFGASDKAAGTAVRLD